MSSHRCRLRFELSSYWRIGSGKGADAIADSLILRDPKGLPLIPGKAVKGLLRDAMSLAALSGTVAPESLTRWFGSTLAGSDDHDSNGDRQEEQLELGRFRSQEGALWFGSAQLPAEWQDWARKARDADRREILGALATYQSSTAIQRDGMVREGSLRVAEVAVPMVLTAEIRGPANDQSWVADVKAALPALRALGSRRNRGLGRVQVTVEEGK